jgi:DNA-binding CsgD family transcriptional regulator
MIHSRSESNTQKCVFFDWFRGRFNRNWIIVLLTQKDCKSLLDCIQELHSFRSQSSLLDWLLDSALPQLIPSDWLSYNDVDVRNPQNSVSIVTPKARPALAPLLPRFKEVVHQHPLVVGQIQADDFPVRKISDFLTEEAYHKLALYQDVYRHVGVEYQIAVPIKSTPDHIAAFALSRQHGDYTERDRAILEMLRPHLVVAFNNLALAAQSKIVLEGTTLALGELCSAMLIVDRTNRILYHTGPGLGWIGATYPGILPERISGWLRSRDGAPQPPAFILKSDTCRIRIRSTPTRAPERLLLVLTREEDSPSLALTSDLALTKREYEVANWIRQGKATAEIAVIIGVSPRTVHKHVQHIYEKLGVETRAGLVSYLHAARSY